MAAPDKEGGLTNRVGQKEFSRWVLQTPSDHGRVRDIRSRRAVALARRV